MELRVIFDVINYIGTNLSINPRKILGHLNIFLNPDNTRLFGNYTTHIILLTFIVIISMFVHTISINVLLPVFQISIYLRTKIS